MGKNEIENAIVIHHRIWLTLWWVSAIIMRTGQGKLNAIDKSDDEYTPKKCENYQCAEFLISHFLHECYQWHVHFIWP